MKLDQIKKFIIKGNEVDKVIYNNKIIYLKDHTKRYLEITPKNLILDKDIKFANIKANENLYYIVQNNLNWVQVDVGIAFGDRKVAHKIIGENYTGRLDRIGTINIIEAEQDQDFSSLSTSYNVIQRGKPEFISIDSENTPKSTFNIYKEGAIKTLDLISNSKLIKYKIISEYKDSIVISDEYMLNYSTPVKFEENIPNDPGANKEYIFNVTIAFMENNTENIKTFKVQFLTENNNILELIFTQSN